MPLRLLVAYFQKINKVTLSERKQRRIANISFIETQQVLSLELLLYTRIVLNHTFFSSGFSEELIFSVPVSLCLTKTIDWDFSVVNKKDILYSRTKDLIGCNQQVLSCAGLRIKRLLLFNNLLVPHAFVCRVLVFFVSPNRNHFLAEANTVSKRYSIMFHRVIWKTLVMEYFLSKVGDLKLSNQKVTLLCVRFFKIVSL